MPNPQKPHEPDAKGGAATDGQPATEPSGPQGDDPSTAGPGNTKVRSNTPENKQGNINPSAPNDANTPHSK